MCGVNVDYDGSPTAYGPPGKPGEDKLSYAGNAKGGTGDWWGVFPMTEAKASEIRTTSKSTRPVVDTAAEKDADQRQPVIQQPGEPSPGHYVSATASVFNGSFHEWRQERYWDSGKFAYGAVSKKLTALGGVHLEDFGMVLRIDRSYRTVYAFKDAGRNDHSVGEVSQKVHRNLGGVYKYDVNYPVIHIVFPGSAGGRPTKADEFEKGVRDQLAKLSKADNFEELPLLLAYYADAGKGKSGLPPLEAFRQKRGSLPSATSLRRMLDELRKLGWPANTGTFEKQMIEEEWQYLEKIMVSPRNRIA